MEDMRSENARQVVAAMPTALMPHVSLGPGWCATTAHALNNVAFEQKCSKCEGAKLPKLQGNQNNGNKLRAN
eukprot:15473244-Alexandrium_andersonii.AAC.1